MDHLPFPKVVNRYPPIEVPYLCRDGFEDVLEFGDLEAYPRLQGVDLECFQYNSGLCDAQDSFLQEWAYFGLLKACLNTRGVKLAVHEFVRVNETGAKVITTAHLVDHFERWKMKGHSETNSDADQFKDLDKVEDYLRFVVPVLTKSLNSINWSRALAGPLSAREALFISFAVLVEALFKMLHEFAQIPPTGRRKRELQQVPEEGSNFQPVVSIIAPFLGALPFFKTRLLRRNWCPNTLASFDPGCNSFYCYLYTQAPPDQANHSNCSLAHCHNLQIVENEYECRHVDDCERCDLIGPDATELATIIEDRDIPVISILENNNQISIRVDRAKDVAGYIAISHVWAQGLGNPFENALPACQLRRISKFCDAIEPGNELITKELLDMGAHGAVEEATGLLGLQGTLHSGKIMPKRHRSFWIDTLCIPISYDSSFQQSFSKTNEEQMVGKTTVAALRKIAIIQLPKIYSNATYVLVLDQQLCAAGNDPFDRLIAFNASSWMRRLWTLQEAVLAKNNLYFRTGDEIVHLYYFCLLVSRELPCRGLHITLAFGSVHYAPRSLSNILWLNPRHVIPTQGCSKSQLVLFWSDVWQLLRQRSTSKPEDEAICIASLLDMDVQRLLDCPKADRMKELYTRLDECLLFELLFINGPRLNNAGFRWAPASLLADASAPSNYHSLTNSTKFQSVRERATINTRQITEELKKIFRDAGQKWVDVNVFNSSKILRELTSNDFSREDARAELCSDGLLIHAHSWMLSPIRLQFDGSLYIPCVVHKRYSETPDGFYRVDLYPDQQKILQLQHGIFGILWYGSRTKWHDFGVLVKMSETWEAHETYGFTAQYVCAVQCREYTLNPIRLEPRTNWKEQVAAGVWMHAIVEEAKYWCVD